MYKVMALDVGTKRIDIALSDYMLMLANGHSYIAREPEDKAVQEIIKIAKENHVEKIVVGLPLNMDNSEGFQAKNCREFASNFHDFEIIFEDERLTSDLAEENLRNKKIDYRKDKGLVDIESACIILEHYLERKG